MEILLQTDGRYKTQLKAVLDPIGHGLDSVLNHLMLVYVKLLRIN